MKLLFIITGLLISSNAMSCYHPHSVTSENIDHFPILAFFDEIDGEIYCKLYLRNTDNFLGLDGVEISVRREKDTTAFFGAFQLEEDIFYKLHALDFIIEKEMITHSWISIKAKSEDLSLENEVMHSCRFSYSIPLSFLYEHSQNNDYDEQYPQIMEFKEKSFITNRKQRPIQDLQPAVKPPGESGEVQRTAAEL